jgi:hypothetical protein
MSSEFTSDELKELGLPTYAEINNALSAARARIAQLESPPPQPETCAHERKFCGWCLHTDIACRDCGEYLTENVGQLDGTQGDG